MKIVRTKWRHKSIRRDLDYTIWEKGFVEKERKKKSRVKCLFDTQNKSTRLSQNPISERSEAGKQRNGSTVKRIRHADRWRQKKNLKPVNLLSKKKKKKCIFFFSVGTHYVSTNRLGYSLTYFNNLLSNQIIHDDYCDSGTFTCCKMFFSSSFLLMMS